MAASVERRSGKDRRKLPRYYFGKYQNGRRKTDIGEEESAAEKVAAAD